jgi:hypothetical protein
MLDGIGLVSRPLMSAISSSLHRHPASMRVLFVSVK